MNTGRTATRYSQFAPSRQLADHVACYWTVTGCANKSASKIRVLPDGCMDAIFDLDGGLAHPSLPSAFFVGVSIVPSIISLPDSPRILGIRFKPGGATPLLNATADELAEPGTSLDDVLPGLDRLVLTHAAEATEPEDMVRILDTLLLERLPRARQIDPLTVHALHALWRDRGSRKVNDIVSDMGINHKRLERAFLRHTGLTPKRMGRTMRFVAAVRSLHATPQQSLAQLAHGLGYVDQAHFTREFTALSGLTPGRWLSEQGDVDYLQYTPVPLG